MSQIIESRDYKGYTIELHPDFDPMNPRTDCDPLGIFYAEHKRYNLGDENATDPRDLNQKTIGVQLPVYMIDHSGIALNTSGFRYCDPQGWDSGQVGIIYLTRDQIFKEYGWKRLTKERKGKLESYLADSIAELSAYYEGNVVGMVILDPDGETLDSCWGFFPDTSAKFPNADFEYVYNEAQSIIDHHLMSLPVDLGIGL